MPTPQPPQIDQMEVIKGLFSFIAWIVGGAITAIVGLVGVLFLNQKETNKIVQDQLNEGATSFSNNAVAIASLKQHVETLTEAVANVIAYHNDDMEAHEEMSRLALEAIRTSVAALDKELTAFQLRCLKDAEEIKHDHETIIRIKEHHFHNHQERL